MARSKSRESKGQCFSGWGATPNEGSFNEPPAMANPFFPTDPTFMMMDGLSGVSGTSPIAPPCEGMLPGQIGEESREVTPSQSLIAHLAATQQMSEMSVPLPTVFWPPPPSPLAPAPSSAKRNTLPPPQLRDRRSSLASNHTSLSDGSDTGNGSSNNNTNRGMAPPSALLQTAVSDSTIHNVNIVIGGWRKRRQTSCQRLQRYQSIQELHRKVCLRHRVKHGGTQSLILLRSAKWLENPYAFYVLRNFI